MLFSDFNHEEFNSEWRSPRIWPGSWLNHFGRVRTLYFEHMWQLLQLSACCVRISWAFGRGRNICIKCCNWLCRVGVCCVTPLHLSVEFGDVVTERWTSENDWNICCDIWTELDIWTKLDIWTALDTQRCFQELLINHWLWVDPFVVISLWVR